ncbi:plasmid stabilization system protein [Gloeomargarita lithophora Alchichica-D10]|uniref:Plasmid stabilization system protein n=1 Tax=Gloeomargarita lithophora Alchichica-D10 TaxID=1188229 RepID=A0A1J0AEC1_9CYAN|nr:type II toxin-antitoxin system RelE/ParE family toxin [Gloeomargarita lithophora]APB34255.1 plasmid stabilization system protein [Gloeomargarita lithophora Alchichica-D10]
MSPVCRFTIPASRDVEAIMDYLADNHNFDVAERFLGMIDNKCRRLATFPSMGRKRDELAPNIRSFPIYDYLIFYREIAAGIEVLRVVSGYRDLQDLFSQQDKN